jgi:peptidyl-prolyl cis-trans isomerase D
MINILRRNQQFLMIIITVLVIIAFVWLYNGTQFDRIVHDEVAKIYGRPVSQAAVDRQARRFQLCVDLQLYDMLQDLAGLSGFDRNQMYENFVWNSMVVRHEAGQLQVQPTDDQVAHEIRNIRSFQTGESFDPAQYNEFLQQKLSPRGFTTDDLEDLVRDHLRLQKLKELLATTVSVSPAEVRLAYEQTRQKLEVAVVRLRLDDFEKAVNLTEDELKKAYEQRKESLKSEEKRKVQLVKFELGEEEKKLAGKERIDALQKLANQANEFTQAVLEKESRFEDVAAKMQAPVASTQLFTQAQPDPLLAANPAATVAAFQLTKEDPHSDVIQSENGFVVLHLEEVQEAKPLTFDEARPMLSETLRQERARESIELKATELRKTLVASLKEGKTFTDAAGAAGQKAEKLPPFSPSEPPADPAAEGEDFGQIQEQAAQLAEGQISQFVPSEAGGLLVCVEKRLPIDEEKFAKEKDEFAKAYARSKQMLTFQEWLRIRRHAAHIEILKS